MVKINIDAPRYDQDTFEGRARHFFATVNPLNCLATEAELMRAKEIVLAQRNGTADDSLTEEEVWKAKELYDSAFHPETGELMILVGRMSFQAPGNMLIGAFMLTFYQSTPAVVFWQFVNQSFNATANYTNRNTSAKVTTEQLGGAYVAATTASVMTAVGLNKFVASRPALAAGVIGRFVPFIAVASANCVNIPLMRQQEIKEGITIQTADGVVAGQSKAAATQAIGQVVPSRILMAVPGLVFPAAIMSKLEKTAALIKNPWLKMPLMLGLSGVFCSLATPIACAIFPQKAAIKVDELEPELQQTVRTRFPGVNTFFFNKGL